MIVKKSNYKADEIILTNTDVLVMDKLIRIQLLNARKSKHITQKQLAELSGLSESCISNIESGSDSSPTLRSLVRYASALGIEIDINLKPSKIKEDEDNM